MIASLPVCIYFVAFVHYIMWVKYRIILLYYDDFHGKIASILRKMRIFIEKTVKYSV